VEDAGGRDIARGVEVDRRADRVDLAAVLHGAVGLAKAATGVDRRSDDRALWCAQRCARCPEHVTYGMKDHGGADGVVVGFCGGATGPEQGQRGPVCHCVVSLTVCGQVRAFGKTLVRGEACPQGEWD
jgi:hypothetical protein